MILLLVVFQRRNGSVILLKSPLSTPLLYLKFVSLVPFSVKILLLNFGLRQNKQL
jgi:hypothetical protein